MEIFKAYAKINLSLAVTGKRDDGYHTLSSVVQSVSLADELEITTGIGALRFSCSNKNIKTEDNLCFMAAKLFFESAGIAPDAEIVLRKNIPVTAGLGGGSTDAGTVLSALNRLYGRPLDKDTLYKIGLKLGADVPVCMAGGTVLMEGIGERLTRLPDLPDCHIVIAKKGEKGSTGEMYKRLDGLSLEKTADTKSIINGLETGDLAAVSRHLYNCFEAVCSEDAISGTKAVMYEKGALYSGLSGSGSSVFGIFNDRRSAAGAANELKCGGCEVYICEPQRHLCE